MSSYEPSPALGVIDASALPGNVDDLGFVLWDGPHPGAVVVDAVNAPGTIVHRTSPRLDVFDRPNVLASNLSPDDQIVVLTWGVGGVVEGMAMRHLAPYAFEAPIEITESISGDGMRPRVLRAFATAPGTVVLFGDCWRKGPHVAKH